MEGLLSYAEKGRTSGRTLRREAKGLREPNKNICIHIYVCMYTYIYIYIIYIYVYSFTYVYMPVCNYVYRYLQIRLLALLIGPFLLRTFLRLSGSQGRRGGVDN